MKKHLLSLVLALIATGIQAQYVQRYAQIQDGLIEKNLPKQAQLRTEENKVKLDSIVVAQNFKIQFTYNSIGQNILATDYSWDTSTKLWSDPIKYEYTYDSKGRQTSFIDSNFYTEQNKYIATEKHDYSYDANGNKILEVYNAGNIKTNQWRIYNKKEYTYDEFDNLTQTIQYSCSGSLNNCSSYRTADYYYYGNNSDSLYIDERYSDYPDSVKSTFYEYVYDSKNNITKSTRYSYDAITNDWIPVSKTENTYDTNVLFSSLNVPSNFFDKGTKSKPISSARYNWDNGWVINENWVFYYSYITTGIDDLPNTASRPKFYPNPATDFLQLENIPKEAHLMLFDIQGTEQLNTTTNTSLLDISHLHAGVYTLKIESKNGQQVYKVVKR
jgi:hypothetical protein